MYPKLSVSVRYTGKHAKKPQPVIDSSACAIQVIRHLFSKETILLFETMILLSLDSSYRLRSWVDIASGGVDYVVPDIRIITFMAHHSAACNVILAHNHPGGSLVPSKQDIEFTYKVQTGLNTQGIILADHIIITDSGHLSLKDCGYL